MPSKGFCSACAVVLFDAAPNLDAVAAALARFSIARRNEEADDWAMSGPAFVLSFRPACRGFVFVDVVDRPWPDDMGNPGTNVFAAWSMSQFGPFAFPGGLGRAAQQSWVWPDGRAIPQRHRAFARVRCNYLTGAGNNDPILPADYDPVVELRFVTDVAAAMLGVPGALCYFNPSGEVLRNAAMLTKSLEFAGNRGFPPLDVWCNVRLTNVNDGWLVMDTVGNEQLDRPDLEACVTGNRYDLQEIDGFLRNITLYLLRQGEVIQDGNTLDGPGGVRWRAHVRKGALLNPPRRTLRLFPEDGAEPPGVLLEDRDET